MVNKNEIEERMIYKFTSQVRIYNKNMQIIRDRFIQ